MSELNYHHLFYFWTAARTGGVAAASRELLISQPTISGQIKSLEEALGTKLFQKAGRGLVLTDMGRVVFSHADDIFAIGRDLVASLESEDAGRRTRLAVGVTDALPKLVTHEILAPAFVLDQRPRLTIREGKLEDLLADLAVHRLDLVLSDVQAPPELSVRVFHHELGSSSLALLGSGLMAKKLRKGFPGSLDGAPIVVPGTSTAMRRSLDRWFDHHEVKPDVIAEVDDSALLKVIGAERGAVVPVCTVVVDQAIARYGFSVIGEATTCVERFFAITPERRLRHDAVRTITELAREAFAGKEES